MDIVGTFRTSSEVDGVRSLWWKLECCRCLKWHVFHNLPGLATPGEPGAHKGLWWNTLGFGGEQVPTELPRGTVLLNVKARHVDISATVADPTGKHILHNNGSSSVDSAG